MFSGTPHVCAAAVTSIIARARARTRAAAFPHPAHAVAAGGELLTAEVRVAVFDRRRAHSVLIFVQSKSSSSATSIGIDVITPCPISSIVSMMRTVSSALTLIQMLGSKLPRPRCGRAERQIGADQQAAAGRGAASLRKVRRVSDFGHVAPPLPCGRALDRAVDALIGAAAADVAGHGGVDLRVGRLRRLGEERRRRHDLARLAVAALRHLLGDPRLLQRMRRRRATAPRSS